MVTTSGWNSNIQHLQKTPGIQLSLNQTVPRNRNSKSCQSSLDRQVCIAEMPYVRIPLKLDTQSTANWTVGA